MTDLQMLPMTEFDPKSSGVGGDCSTNCATTAAHLLTSPCFLNRLTLASFCLFSVFQTQTFQKNCRLQRDSKWDRKSRKRARLPLDHHHGPLPSTCNLQYEDRSYGDTN